MGHGLDERWGGGVWILGTENSICGKDRRATYFNSFAMVAGQGMETSGGSSNIEVGTVDQGVEIAEHGESCRALGDCVETASNWLAGEMVVGHDIGIYGGSTDTLGGTADQGDETVENSERGKAAIDGAVAAGEMSAAQGTLYDGEGGVGGMAAMGIPDRSTMSRAQWKRFKEASRRIQGRK